MILQGYLIFLLSGTIVCASIMWMFRKGGTKKFVFGPGFKSPFMGTFSACWLGIAFFRHHLFTLFILNICICMLCVVLKKTVVEKLFQKKAVTVHAIAKDMGSAVMPALAASAIGVLTLPFFFSL